MAVKACGNPKEGNRKQRKAMSRDAHPGVFYFQQKQKRVLLTNDAGHFSKVSLTDFQRFMNGRLSQREAVWQELQAKGFVRSYMDFNGLAKQYRELNDYLFRGPSLHIFVTTLRCNHKCLYCHASAEKPSRKNTDMTVQTAQAAVDFVFKSPNPALMIEFQGGEPLLNWPVLKFAISYARSLSEASRRNLQLALVTNLSLMDHEKLDFLLKHEVSICTSLDGPAVLHNKNRALLGGEAHERVGRWIREIRRRYDEEQAPRRKIFKPSALMTTTRFSLPLWKEVVDEYVSLGLEDVFFRPLSPIGYAKRVWPQIGYSAEEYLNFYRKGLDYILKLNRRGSVIVERGSAILLTRILRRKDPGFVDLRSPCGAAIGQLAFDYDGQIYTCDEGRMVAQQGDPLFRVGSLKESRYQDLMSSSSCRVICMASSLESQPVCRQCVYKPYCGVCPVHNYEAQGSLWGSMPASDYCTIHKGMFDILFERLESKENMRIFESWLRPRRGETDGEAMSHNAAKS